MIKVRVVRTKRDGVVLKWTDPITGPRQVKAEGRNRRAHEEQRRELEDELNHQGTRLTWQRFYDRFWDSYLCDMSPGHQGKCSVMSERLVRAAERRRMKPLFCKDITTNLVTSVEDSMRDEGLSEATIRSNMATLWSILSWGVDEELIHKIHRPRRRRGKRSKILETASKGRSLTLEEVERLEDAIAKCVKPYEPPQPFVRAARAARLIGLRLSDCWLFRWEPMEDTHYVENLHGRTPAISFCPAQKSGRREIVPLTPPAIAWLRSIEQESGWVCRTRGAKGEHRTSNRLGRVIAAAGKAAGIVVKQNGGRGGKPKYASLHDLRRTFATTWHQRLTVAELQRLTRHGDPQTLMRYYADAPDSTLVEKLQRYSDSILCETSGGEMVGPQSALDHETQ